jgi:hypothetical protein
MGDFYDSVLILTGFGTLKGATYKAKICLEFSVVRNLAGSRIRNVYNTTKCFYVQALKIDRTIKGEQDYSSYYYSLTVR